LLMCPLFLLLSYRIYVLYSIDYRDVHITHYTYTHIGVQLDI
jgi:hypothetical protein